MRAILYMAGTPKPTYIAHQLIRLTPEELLEALPYVKGVYYAMTDTGAWVASQDARGFHLACDEAMADWSGTNARIKALEYTEKSFRC